MSDLRFVESMPVWDYIQCLILSKNLSLRRIEYATLNFNFEGYLKVLAAAKKRAKIDGMGSKFRYPIKFSTFALKKNPAEIQKYD